MGRPKIELDYGLIEELALIHCTQKETASVLGVSTRTLQRNSEFCRIYKKCMNEGRKSLRRLQWDVAEAGNVTMLIWLGKQYLSQTDKQELKGSVSGELNANVNHNIIADAPTLRKILGDDKFNIAEADLLAAAYDAVKDTRDNES